VKYTPEFWKAARALEVPGARFCQQCRGEHGAKNAPRVRLVLQDNNPANLTPANLAMMCTRCHPDPIYTREPRAVKPSRVTAKLFD
jgi:hypothetical protein